ncbi:MAG: ROK family transcriptional regulator [Hyphomicrobiales bacterium]|nr:ROK family transcriptional regulator [Hyphomicrobiales bacterium]
MTRSSRPKPVLRQLSLGSVMDAIINHGPISRADVAKLTRISKQTASEVVRELESGGWVRVHGQTKGGIGRTAVTYAIEPDAAYVAGVDLGGTQVRMAIANLACSIVAEASEITDPVGGQTVVRQIAKLADRLVREAGIARDRVRLLVIGTPGVLDVATGSIRLAPNVPDFDKIDVVGSLRDAFGADVIIENDVNVGALGERWLGQAKGLDTFVYIALGTGLGMGIVSDGKIIRGAHGGAGEIANLPIGGDPFDAASRLHGTLEAAVGSGGIAQRYEAAGGKPGITVRELFDRLPTDSVARGVVDESARLLALAVVAVVATVDPQIVVFGGSIGARREIVDAINELVRSLGVDSAPIVSSALGNRAGISGALAIGINNIQNALFAPSFTPRVLSLPAVDELRGLGAAT